MSLSQDWSEMDGREYLYYAKAMGRLIEKRNGLLEDLNDRLDGWFDDWEFSGDGMDAMALADDVIMYARELLAVGREIDAEMDSHGMGMDFGKEHSIAMGYVA